MAEISVTLKAGGGYDAPWINVKGDSAKDISQHLAELRELGAFSAVRTLAAEFAAAEIVTTEQAVASIAQNLGGQEVPASQPQRPAAPAQTAQPTGQVQQGTPPCEKCGAPTNHRSGTGRTGDWSALFCSSGNRDHTKFLD